MSNDSLIKESEEWIGFVTTLGSPRSQALKKVIELARVGAWAVAHGTAIEWALVYSSEEFSQDKAEKYLDALSDMPDFFRPLEGVKHATKST